MEAQVTPMQAYEKSIGRRLYDPERAAWQDGWNAAVIEAGNRCFPAHDYDCCRQTAKQDYSAIIQLAHGGVEHE